MTLYYTIRLKLPKKEMLEIDDGCIYNAANYIQ